MKFTTSLIAVLSLITAAAAKKYDVEVFSAANCSGTVTAEAVGVNIKSGCINVDTSHSVFVNTLGKGCNLTLFAEKGCRSNSPIADTVVKFKGKITDTCLDPAMPSIQSFRARC